MKLIYKTKQLVPQELVKWFKQDIHYYLEGDRVVFTALFHIQRGICCGTGCRHCPYNPKFRKGNVVLSKEVLKFETMRLEELQKQLEQIQSMDFKSLPPEKLEKIIEQLTSMTNEGEELLNNEIQKINTDESDD